MAQSIASLSSLKALRPMSHSYQKATLEAKAVQPLALVKDLRHIIVWDSGGFQSGFNRNNKIQSILFNSALSLRSLRVNSSPFVISYWYGWEKLVSADDTSARQEHTLTDLKELTLSGCSIIPSIIQSMQRAINFMSSRELVLAILAGINICFIDILRSRQLSF